MSLLEQPNDQVRSPNYPTDYSWIEFDATTAGSVDTLFDMAIQDHGNNRRFTWPSYAKDSNDTFTVELLGKSEAPIEQTDYYQMHRWELSLNERRRKLVIDTGLKVIQRFEGEFLVPGISRDVSDLIAASLNIREYNEERRAQGWNPAFDDILRREGLL